MKSEYDFSKGDRGKFYHADAVLDLPVYLDPGGSGFCPKGIGIKRG
jgi:hypothetical protein